MFRIPFRRQLHLASLSADVVGKFRFIWKNTRKYTQWTIKTYNRVAVIADKFGIEKPVPLTKMEEEN